MHLNLRALRNFLKATALAELESNPSPPDSRNLTLNHRVVLTSQDLLWLPLLSALVSSSWSPGAEDRGTWEVARGVYSRSHSAMPRGRGLRAGVQGRVAGLTMCPTIHSWSGRMGLWHFPWGWRELSKPCPCLVQPPSGTKAFLSSWIGRREGRQFFLVCLF